jgi:DNA-binding NarL/FixJ family response regulator
LPERDAHTVSRALQNGASGFVPKAYSSERLVEALYQVLEDQIFVPERMRPTQLGADLPPTPVQILPTGDSAPAAEYGLTECKAGQNNSDRHRRKQRQKEKLGA